MFYDKIKKLIYFSLLLWGCSNTEKQKDSNYLVLKNISIVDVIEGNLAENQTVVVKDSIIHFIGEKWVPTKSLKIATIDGSGKFLLPGLWDMHVHISWHNANDSLLFPAFLKNGILGLRDMGGSLDIQNKMKGVGDTSKIVRPEIFGAGPIIDGDPPVMYDFSISVDKENNVPALLDSLVDQGADFFKTYSLIKESELIEISDYSSRHHVPFAGHLSELIDPEISIGLGQKSIEHLNRLDEISRTDSLRLIKIANEMIANNTWLCPTLIIYHNKAHMNDSSIINTEYQKYIHPILAEEWEHGRTNKVSKNDSIDWIREKERLSERLTLVNYLHQKGIRILAGSDLAGMPFVYPGIGLLQELELLSKSGLSNMEVLKAATINPARYLGISEKYGSVTVGNFADLLVLNKNPLDSIQNIYSIESVFRKGEKIINSN